MTVAQMQFQPEPSISRHVASLNASIFIFQRRDFHFNSHMTFNLEHIGLPAKDSAALKNWYERVLGARPLWDNGQYPPTTLLALGNAWVEIYPADKSRPETADNKLAGFRHLALRAGSKKPGLGAQ